MGLVNLCRSRVIGSRDCPENMTADDSKADAAPAQPEGVSDPDAPADQPPAVSPSPCVSTVKPGALF